ncbi:MAG TPA: PEGA domain-containing protein [Myxococcota bacterium]|nr:PEGA domain-containing protein [Myxococcota bacterium]
MNSIPRAQIHVDGASIGSTPIVRHRVAAGEHRVTARFDDGKSDERTIRVGTDELYLMFDGR